MPEKEKTFVGQITEAADKMRKVKNSVGEDIIIETEQERKAKNDFDGFIKEAWKQIEGDIMEVIKTEDLKQRLNNEISIRIKNFKTDVNEGQTADNLENRIDNCAETVLKELPKRSKIHGKIKNLFRRFKEYVKKLRELCMVKKKIKDKEFNDIDPQMMKEFVRVIALISEYAQREEIYKKLGEYLAERIGGISSDNKIFEKGSKENKKFMKMIRDSVERDGIHYDEKKEKNTDSLLSKMQSVKKEIELSKKVPEKSKEEIKMS